MQGAKSVWLSPIVEFGVYVINNDSLPFPHMIGRAKLAALGLAIDALTPEQEAYLSSWQV